jgi:hypothetical protein
VLRSRDAVAPLTVLGVLLACGVCRPAAANAQVFSEELRIEGAWPEITLSGGGGIGLGNTLDSNVFGKLRLGALYVYEPWIFAGGVIGELGALAERGVGAELEVHHFGGLWAQVGGSRVLRSQWMGHLTFGFAVFGVEWQHRFGENSNALLFLLRAPIGLWWFLLEDDAARNRRQHADEE